MKISEVIRPGDKVDIELLQQVEQNHGDYDSGKMYKSQVLDVIENDNIEISMPIEGGKLQLLPLGVRYEFMFYSMGSLYRGVGQIKERYKRENVYMLEIELRSQLEKYQRREFYRFPCLMDVNYYVLTEEEMELEPANAVFVQLQQKENKDREKVGQIIDLSGGGMKFIAKQELAPKQHLLITMRLISTSIDQQFCIVGSVISCEERERVREKEKNYEIRFKFLLEDDKIREQIIRYIFEEERRTRQRDVR